MFEVTASRAQHKPVHLRINGELIDDIPEAALPDCSICDKPELMEQNHEAVTLYTYVAGQQTWGPAGHRMGMRAEAVKAVLDELCAQGVIEDRDRAFRMVWTIDRAVNAYVNAKLDAKIAADAAAAKAPTK